MPNSAFSKLQNVTTQPGLPGEQLARFFELAWQYQMEEYPEWGTFLGYSQNNDKWTDRTPVA